MIKKKRKRTKPLPPIQRLIERVRKILDETPEWNGYVLDSARLLLRKLEGVDIELRELETLARDHNMKTGHRGVHARSKRRNKQQALHVTRSQESLRFHQQGMTWEQADAAAAEKLRCSEHTVTKSRKIVKREHLL